MNLVTEIRKYPVAYEEAFVHHESALDAAVIERLYSKVKWSPEGSNRYIEELRIHAYWRDFLLDLEGIIIINYKY